MEIVIAPVCNYIHMFLTLCPFAKLVGWFHYIWVILDYPFFSQKPKLLCCQLMTYCASSLFWIDCSVPTPGRWLSLMWSFSEANHLPPEDVFADDSRFVLSSCSIWSVPSELFSHLLMSSGPACEIIIFLVEIWGNLQPGSFWGGPSNIQDHIRMDFKPCKYALNLIYSIAVIKLNQSYAPH